MKGLTPKKMAAACGGTAVHCEEILDTEVTAVTADSRQITGGCLFVPIRGERADGHRFIESAFEQGAAVTLTERAEAAGEHPCILVEDTRIAIQRIAELYRREMDIPVVGITGSVGKTSTKEMIASVLSQKYNTLYTKGNFNNNLGLPLTIFRLKPEHEIAVLEMGISHPGEMEDLARTARPDTMVITNIGACHLEALGDLEGVFREKTVSLAYLPKGGTAVLNGEDALLAAAEAEGEFLPLYYGRDPRCRIYADEIVDRGLEGSAFMLHIDDRDIPVSLPLPGEHMILNALAAASVGALYGLSDREIRRGIAAAGSLAGRMSFRRGREITVIDDCYNANPVSMKASLAVLARAEGKKTAILGDMKELGAGEKEWHRDVGACAAALPLDKVILVGELAEEIGKEIRAEKPGQQVFFFADVEALLPKLSELLEKGETVLVKASHSMGFSRIVEALTGEE